MGKTLLIATLIIGTQAQAENAFQLLSPAQYDAGDFDFRDENNRPIKGNKSKIQALFTESAYRLLVLGATTVQGHIKDFLSTTVQKCGLLTQKAVQKWKEITAGIGRFLNHPHPSLSPQGKGIKEDKFLHPTHLLMPALFKGAAVPLRL